MRKLIVKAASLHSTFDSVVLSFYVQDEIWSEVVLKRIKSLRENTKEGCFGSIPYSFMTSSMRSR